MKYLFEKKKQKSSLKVYIWGAVLGLFIGLVSFLPIYAHYNGQYMDFGDYFLQYVPFIKEMKRMVASGNLAWSWNSFLGDSFTSAYSYYTVYNPFAWFVMLFPSEYILYGTMAATLVKFSLSMISSLMYMKLFCKRDASAILGALLYTFSGFTCINTMFYFFLDVIAVFPFLLYGLEILIRTGKRKFYILSVLLNAAINYYLFTATVVFTVIYVIFRLELYKISMWKQNRKIFGHIVVYSILGTGLATFALLPSLCSILGSGKASSNLGSFMSLTYWPQEILERLKTFVAPVESGRYYSFYDSSIWSSTGMYLPIFGCFLVLQWCHTHKGWQRNICVFLAICYFVPVLNAAFSLFSSEVYARWLYGLILVSCSITALELEEIEDNHQSFSVRMLSVISVVTAVLLLVPTIIYLLYAHGISVVNRFASACSSESFTGYERLFIMLALTAINYIVLWILVLRKTFKMRTAIVFAIGGCILNFFVYNYINFDFHPSVYNNDQFYEKSLVEGTESIDNQYEYRIDSPTQIANYGLFKNRPSVNYYNSLQHPGSSKFASAVGIAEGIQDTILVGPTENREYTDALLSVKYFLDYDGNTAIPNDFELIGNDNGVDIYLNNNYIPMGFVYEEYCTEDYSETLSTGDKAALMLHTLVVREDDLPEIQQYLNKHADSSASEFIQDIQDRKATAGSKFAGTSSGFTAEINLEKDNIVFYSVPFDNGWEITVNGDDTTAYSVNYGLLGIPCRAGINHIQAIYHPHGVVLGIFCSIIFALMWGSFEWFDYRKTRKSYTREKNMDHQYS